MLLRSTANITTITTNTGGTTTVASALAGTAELTFDSLEVYMGTEHY